MQKHPRKNPRAFFPDPRVFAVFEFQDQDNELTNKNDKQLLRRLHVKTEDKILEGAEAFLIVWKKIPKYHFLYKFFKLPGVFSIFKFGYEIVAYFLYLKNKKQLKN